MSDNQKTAIAVVITVLVTWGLTKFTDTVDAGADAQTKDIALEVIAEEMKMDNGKHVKHVVSEINERTIRIEEALRALVEE